MSEYKLVPVKLTPEMAQAIESADMPGTTLQEMWQPSWDAALAAAPADPAPDRTYPKWYVDDLHDTLDQVAAALGLPERDADKMIALAKQLTAPADPAPRELTTDEQSVMDAALRKSAKVIERSAAPADPAPCDCGCNDPVATDPIGMLRFLSQRFKFAGVGEAVALSYARDIDKILAAPAASLQEKYDAQNPCEHIKGFPCGDCGAAAPADPVTTERVWQLADEYAHHFDGRHKDNARAALRAEVERLVRERDHRLAQSDYWQDRAERAEREMAEQRQVMLGVGPITCRNGIVHEREDGCLYCRAERGDEALALLLEARKVAPFCSWPALLARIDALTRRKG